LPTLGTKKGCSEKTKQRLKAVVLNLFKAATPVTLKFCLRHTEQNTNENRHLIDLQSNAFNRITLDRVNPITLYLIRISKLAIAQLI
jgi:hypothetical protein